MVGIIAFCLASLAIFASGDEIHTEKISFGRTIQLSHCDTQDLTPFDIPHRSLCALPSMDFQSKFRKKKVRIYIHEKNNIVVPVTVCEKFQTEHVIKGWFTSGDDEKIVHKIPIRVDECVDWKPDDSKHQRETAGFHITSRSIFDEPTIERKEVMAYVDIEDRILLPNVHPPPKVSNDYYVDHNAVFLWSSNILDHEYIDQGEHECQVKDDFYICNQLKVAFHLDPKPKIVKHNGIYLQKTREGLFLLTEETGIGLISTDVSDSADERSYADAQLTYNDELIALVTVQADNLESTIECINRNYLIDHDEDRKMGPLITKQLTGSLKSMITIKDRKWYTSPCKLVTVDGYVKIGYYFKLIELNGNVHYYDPEIGALVTSPTKWMGDIELPQATIHADGKIIEKENKIITGIRQDYIRKSVSIDPFVKVVTVMDKLEHVTEQSRSSIREYLINPISEFLDKVTFALWFVFILVCCAAGIYFYYSLRTSTARGYRQQKKSEDELEMKTRDESRRSSITSFHIDDEKSMWSDASSEELQRSNSNTKNKANKERKHVSFQSTSNKRSSESLNLYDD